MEKHGTHPAKQATPPQSPTDPPQLPPLTKKQKIKFALFAAFFVFAIGLWAVWNISQNSESSDLVDNGVKTQAVSTGEYHQRTSRSLRSSQEVFKAWYSFTSEDGVERTALGEKEYKSADDIKAGVTVDLYYDPDDASKGTYVTNEP